MPPSPPPPSPAPPQTISPLRGFSSAKFLPGSRDSVIIALKSEENSERDRQTSYFTVYGENDDGSWRVLLDEVELPGEAKFEGLEVLSWS
jgi:soluble calcium-activated nucleotidase 1